MPFEVDLLVDTSTGAFEDYTQRQVEKLEEAIREEVDALSEALAEQLRWAYSGGIVQQRTGAAADSVKVIPATMEDEVITGSVQAGGDGAPEVEWLEYGTRPHVIYPHEEGGTLAFIWGGNQRFFKYVFHPGTRAYHIFDAAEQIVPDYEEELASLPDRLSA